MKFSPNARAVALSLFLLSISINIIAYAQRLNLEYSTFLGGSSEDRAHGMAVDSRGNIYLTAPIQSVDFPLTSKALSSAASGIFAAKLNSTGDSLVFSTYLGKNGGANYAHGIAVDKNGNIYIAGNTSNPDFPTTPGAYDTTFNGPPFQSHGDAFVMKLNPEGNKIFYSTFIGGKGMDICGKIAVDDKGNAYILGTTSSSDFPVTPDAFDITYNGGDTVGRGDIFVAKLNSEGSRLLYCTYIGGSSTDLHGSNIIVDKSGSAYFAGTTESENFPTTANAYDTSYNGGSGDGIIVKFNSTGTKLEYSTFIGGPGDDFANSLILNDQGDIYVAGFSGSQDFPVTQDAYSRKCSNAGFISQIDTRLDKLIYSTFWDVPVQSIAFHRSGCLVLAGSTESKNLYVTPDAYDTCSNGSGDIYLSIFDQKTKKIKYGTYLGGMNADNISSMILDDRSIYLSGNTISTDFPTTKEAYDKTFNGGTNRWGGDAFAAKFSFKLQ